MIWRYAGRVRFQNRVSRRVGKVVGRIPAFLLEELSKLNYASEKALGLTALPLRGKGLFFVGKPDGIRYYFE